MVKGKKEPPFKDPYLNTAYELVPPGERPPVDELRQGIAKAIKEAVDKALQEQLDHHFPDIQRERQRIQDLADEWRRYANALEDQKEELKKREKAFEQEMKAKTKAGEEALKQKRDAWDAQVRADQLRQGEIQYQTEMRLKAKEQELQLQAAALVELLQAIDHYHRWICGEGEVEENATRFQALAEALDKYQQSLPNTTLPPKPKPDPQKSRWSFF